MLWFTAVLCPIMKQSFSYHTRGREQWQTDSKTTRWTLNSKLEGDSRSWSQSCSLPGRIRWKLENTVSEGEAGQIRADLGLHTCHGTTKEWVILATERGFTQIHLPFLTLEQPRNLWLIQMKWAITEHIQGKPSEFLLGKVGLHSASIFFSFASCHKFCHWALIYPWCLVLGIVSIIWINRPGLLSSMCSSKVIFTNLEALPLSLLYLTPTAQDN